MEWTSCTDKLPEEGALCWVCDKDQSIYAAYFENNHRRHKWTPAECIVSVEPSFVTDESNEHYAFLEEILFWMPYFTPSLPLEFYYEDSLKDWIRCEDQLPEFNQKCRFITHGIEIEGRHGVNGHFEGIYTHSDGRKIKHDTKNVSHWKQSLTK